MDEHAEYPKAAYKLGGDFQWDGKSYEVRILTDADDEAAAAREGFSTNPAEATGQNAIAQPVSEPQGDHSAE